MHHHDHDDQKGDEYLEREGFLEGSEGFADEFAAIVKRDDGDVGGLAVVEGTFRESRGDACDFVLDGGDDGGWVFAGAKGNDPAGGFRTVDGECTATCGRPLLEYRYILQYNRHVPSGLCPLLEHHRAQILDRSYRTDTSDQIFYPV